MSDIVYLSPSTVALLDAECKTLLSGLCVEIIEEDMISKDCGDTIFKGRYRTWLTTPRPKIRKIDSSGVETILCDPADMSIDYNSGEVTLTSALAADEILRADYFYSPMNDAQLEELLQLAIKEVSVLIHRPIDENAIVNDYKGVVCKRLYTNVLKNLIVEARNFFTVSVGDRTINKDQIPGHLEAMKKSNEEDLLLEIKQLRDWNRTNRFE